MDKSQAMNLNNETQFSDDTSIEITDDHIWKAFYSHSYTILFNCEKCDQAFDIDGWFYRFDNLTCPKCGSSYSGIFGQLILNDKNGRSSDRVALETFEGQQFEFSIAPGSKRLTGKNGHIVLVVFIKQTDRQTKPWGIIDYSEAKPQLELFNLPSSTGGHKGQKPETHKPKSFLANLFFG